MQTDHGEVRDDLSAEWMDLIKALPTKYVDIGPFISPARHAWRAFRNETGCHEYEYVQQGALSGDTECQMLMARFALIYLKLRLTS